MTNLIAKNYTLVDVNISASTLVIDLKLWEFIPLLACKVLKALKRLRIVYRYLIADQK